MEGLILGILRYIKKMKLDLFGWTVLVTSDVSGHSYPRIVQRVRRGVGIWGVKSKFG